ncbi:hypothetical protein ACFWBG_30295 [Nocardia salmonicida]|uniref:hypothetical protein n=1 Tax=Nocardia salmonicida TaxID=53431 RepID=UPI00366D38B0
MKRGKLSENALPEGIWVRALVLRPYISLTPSFDNLSVAEQDSELAGAVVISDRTEAGMPKLLAIATVIGLPLGALTGYVAGRLDVPEVLGFDLVLGLFLCVWTGLYVIGAFAWSRRMIFQADRKVAEVLGVAWATTGVQISQRMRYKRRGMFGIYLGLSMPIEAHRLEALADLTADPTGQRS